MVKLINDNSGGSEVSFGAREKQLGICNSHDHGEK